MIGVRLALPAGSGDTYMERLSFTHRIMTVTIEFCTI